VVEMINQELDWFLEERGARQRARKRKISPNPGVTPYLIKSDETFYDFFCMKAKQFGTDSDELSKKLFEQFPK
jgi:hypothetical protein